MCRKSEDSIRGRRPMTLLLVMVCLVVSGLAYAAQDFPRIKPFEAPAGDLPWVEGEVVVQLRSSATESDLTALGSNIKILKKGQYMPGLYKLSVPSGMTTDQFVQKLRSEKIVIAAERNYKHYPMATPDDPLYKLFRYPDYPDYSFGQWALQPDALFSKDHIYAPEAWDLEKGKRDVVVAVIDTGLCDSWYSYDNGARQRRAHPDLGGYHREPCITTDGFYNYDRYVPDDPDDPGTSWYGRILPYGYDFADEDWNPSPSDSDQIPIIGTAPHGTHVSGIVAAKTNNTQGVAALGWNGIWVLPLKVFADDAWYADTVDVCEALMYCVWFKVSGVMDDTPLKVDVVNLSLGSQYASAIERSAISNVVQSGIVVVAAAGNDWDAGPYPPSYPAAYDGVICVGASNEKDLITAFSQRGHAVDIAAPGYDILSTYWYRGYADDGALKEYFEGKIVCDPTQIIPEPDPDSYPYEPFDNWGNGYAYMSGTSMASPMVAAAAALLRSLDVPAKDVEGILEQTATPVGIGRPNETYGYGILNAYKAVKTACIDVEIQTPSNGGSVPTKRPKLRVDFRRANPDTIKVWLDPIDLDKDGTPDSLPNIAGTDADFDQHYYILDEQGGKAYVQFEADLTTGLHKIYATAETSLEFDTPPAVPLSDEDDAVFTVNPQYLTRGWHLLSVPFKLDSTVTPEVFFQSESGVMARWHYANSAAGEYAIYSLDGSRNELEASFSPPSIIDAEGNLDEKLVHPSGNPYVATPPAGVGYWAYLPAAVEYPDTGGESVNTAPYDIGLYRGWNMVGNPFAFPVAWTSVAVEYATQRTPLEEAVANGWIYPYVFRYDTLYRRYVTQPITGAVMKPWEAVWVKVLAQGPDGWPQADAKFIVPPNPYSGQLR